MEFVRVTIRYSRSVTSVCVLFFCMNDGPLFFHANFFCSAACRLDLYSSRDTAPWPCPWVRSAQDLRTTEAPSIGARERKFFYEILC